MRDCRFIVTEYQGLDVDFINGEPEYLASESQTYDQRASVACYMVKGTLIGRQDLGIRWGDQLSNDNTLMNLSNEVQQAVQAMAGGSTDNMSTVSAGYNAQVVVQGNETGVIIMRG